MRARVLLLPAITAVVALVTAGCSGGSATSAPTAAGAASSSGTRGTIGIAMPTTTSPRWISDSDNIQRQLNLLGYGVEVGFGENDVAKQVSQLEAMIAKGDKALVIGSIDGSKLTDVLAKAAAAKIPVIAYDRLIRGTPNIDYYATFDNLKVGVLEAQAIVDGLGLAAGRGPFTIELFAGSPDDNNAGFFFDGAMSVLRPYLKAGRLTVPSGQTAFAQVTTKAWDGKTAQDRMTKLLAGPDAGVRVDAVLSPYDGISRGILAAFQGAGYGSGGKALPLVTGQDAELDSVKLIATGRQTETVYKDTRELAKVAVQMVDALLTDGVPAVNDTSQYDNGVKKVPTFLLQPIGVDKSNYRRVLVGGGYYTDAQVGA